MAEINDLNVTDASNTARFPENQAPSTVNDGARALEGLIARWHKDTNASVASTGSSNAYVVAANQTLSAYYDGLEIWFDANFANTDSATLNVDSVGAATMKKLNDQDLESGDIEANQKVGVIYDGTNWQVISPLAQATLADNQVTLAKIATLTANRLVGSDGSGNPAEVTADTTLTLSGSSLGVDVAAKADAEAETANKIIDAAIANDLPGVNKGWVKFSISAVISVSHNVSSITDDALGLFTVNWDTNFSSANYAAFSDVLLTADPRDRHTQILSQAAGTLQVETVGGSSNTEDSISDVFVAGFGDQ